MYLFWQASLALIEWSQLKQSDQLHLSQMYVCKWHRNIYLIADELINRNIFRAFRYLSENYTRAVSRSLRTQ